MDEWLRSLSGKWGPSLLALYTDHSIWINTIVVLYGALLLLSWRNLRRIRSFLHAEVARQIDGAANEVELSSLDVPWEQALKVSTFPLIAAEWGLLPRRVSVEHLQSLVTVEELLSKA